MKFSSIDIIQETLDQVFHKLPCPNLNLHKMVTVKGTCWLMASPGDNNNNRQSSQRTFLILWMSLHLWRPCIKYYYTPRHIFKVSQPLVMVPLALCFLVTGRFLFNQVFHIYLNDVMSTALYICDKQDYFVFYYYLWSCMMSTLTRLYNTCIFNVIIPRYGIL